MDEPVGGCAHL